MKGRRNLAPNRNNGLAHNGPCCIFGEPKTFGVSLPPGDTQGTAQDMGAESPLEEQSHLAWNAELGKQSLE